jgi:hypothetical protein
MTDLHPHPSARQVFRWAWVLHQLGVHETAGLKIVATVYDTAAGAPSLTLRIYGIDGDLLFSVFVGSCRADGEGPVRADVYCPGAWACDRLFR